MRKKTGHCTLCDEPVYEVRTTWPEGHPYAGEPRELGAAHEGTMKLGFALTGGSTVELTFCEPCSHEASGNLVKIWQRCLATQAYEIRNITKIGTKPRTKTEMFQLVSSNMKLAQQVPLGVLYQRKWVEIRSAMKTEIR